MVTATPSVNVNEQLSLASNYLSLLYQATELRERLKLSHGTEAIDAFISTILTVIKETK